jgi:hypothetical protein
VRNLLTGLAVAALAMPFAAAAQESTPARGVFKTGEQIYVDCVATDAAALGRCDWFLMGAHDMASFYQDTDQVEVAFCLPKGTTADTIRKIAVDRWRAKPESRRFSAVSGFLNALSEKYPGACKD